MQWAVQYQLYNGTIGLCIFSAEGYVEATLYILEMMLMRGYEQVFNLQPVSSIEDLWKKFPVTK